MKRESSPVMMKVIASIIISIITSELSHSAHDVDAQHVMNQRPQGNITLKDVTKRFGDTVAVDNESLQIDSGEFFSLLGPSGYRKTTTLRMIGGFEPPTSGEIYINDQPTGHTPPFQRDVNTVFQSYALFPHKTVAQNIAFGLQMKKRPKTEIGARVNQFLEMVRLPGYGGRKPNALSGGEKQRVALACVLINHPAAKRTPCRA